MELAIVAIFQNEAPYLDEWIRFHLLMGSEHFYLFDHMSTDSPKKVLAPYIEQGFVQLVSWPIEYGDVHEWTEVQCLAYERALHWAAGKTKWLAIIDVDEFLFSVRRPLLDELKRYESYGGVGVNWQVFGTSNIERVPNDKLLIEVMNLKLPKEQGTNHHVKSIVRPERVKSCDNAHSMTYHAGFFQVNTAEVPFEGCLSPTVEIDPLRINHYTLRDEHYLTTQKIPRLEKWWGNSIDWRSKYQGMNVVEDKSIHMHIDPLIRPRGLI